MDAHRRDEVADAALDRELQAMLGLDPSPEFVARVRARVADDPSPASRWFGVWTIVASAVAVAAIAIVALVVGRDARTVPPSGQPVLDSRSATLPVWTAPDLTGRSRVQSAGTDRPARAGHSETPAVREAATSQRAEPEILLDPREAAALRALIFGTRDGRIDLAPLVNASTPSVMELPPVVDIEIPLITIDPITPGTGEEGVRQ
jgi:hypothetical protein